MFIVSANWKWTSFDPWKEKCHTCRAIVSFKFEAVNELCHKSYSQWEYANVTPPSNVDFKNQEVQEKIEKLKWKLEIFGKFSDKSDVKIVFQLFKAEKVIEWKVSWFLDFYAMSLDISKCSMNNELHNFYEIWQNWSIKVICHLLKYLENISIQSFHLF